ncbi:hypothetical protein LBMAG48_27790 [Phycisphaerae bacterium]|nr:hypothetical protein LBMAG48_27790 [Phycisphaerae bacterium]
MASGLHYMPQDDDALALWLLTFAGGAADWYSNAGIDNVDAQRLLVAAPEFAAALERSEAAIAAAREAVADKNDVREGVVALARLVARQLQVAPGMTNGARAGMGLPTRRETLNGVRVGGSRRGAAGGGNAPVSVPVVRVEKIVRLRHELRLTDSESPTRTAKPRDAFCAEVRLAIVDVNQTAPLDPAAMPTLALVTDGKVQAEFASENKGKQAVYSVRWIGTTGAAGPWGEEVRAVVAA